MEWQVCPYTRHFHRDLTYAVHSSLHKALTHTQFGVPLLTFQRGQECATFCPLVFLSLVLHFRQTSCFLSSSRAYHPTMVLPLNHTHIIIAQKPSALVVHTTIFDAFGRLTVTLVDIVGSFTHNSAFLTTKKNSFTSTDQVSIFCPIALFNIPLHILATDAHIGRSREGKKGGQRGVVRGKQNPWLRNKMMR